MSGGLPNLGAADHLLAALALPPGARVEQRVPEKLLLEHGAPTRADRQHVQEGLDALVWTAVLKPATVGIPAYSDGVRDYTELAVLTVALRLGVRPTRAARIAGLVHRAVPYPVVLVVAQGDAATVSLAHKRRSQAAAEAVVAELPAGTATLATAPDGPDAAIASAFLAALALGDQPQAHLLATYQGWMDCMPAPAAARLTGRWAVPASAEASAGRQQALDEYAYPRREAAALHTAVVREPQLARRVAINIELRRLDARLARLTSTI